MPLCIRQQLICSTNEHFVTILLLVFDNIRTKSQLEFKSNITRKLAELPDEFGLGPMVCVSLCDYFSVIFCLFLYVSIFCLVTVMNSSASSNGDIYI